MAPRIGAIQARTRVAEFMVEGDDWRIEYRPFSQDVLREATQGGEAEQMAGLTTLLTRVIVTWNLLDDAGQPLAFDPTYLASWGLDYVRDLLTGLMADQSGPKAPSTPSPAPSVLPAVA